MRSPRERRLARCHSIHDLRGTAKGRLPRAVFDFADGGAEDETTLRRNTAGFDRFELVPKVLVDVADVRINTSILGQQIDLPVILAPTGMNRLFHPDGERAVARAGHRAGTVYTLSSMSSMSIAELAAAAPAGLNWFQVYVWRDRGLVKELFSRCRESGYDALCLTVDVPVLGQRERDLRNGMTMPPRLTAGAILDAAAHPNWWWRFLMNPRPTFSNVIGQGEAGKADASVLGTYVNTQFDPSVDWDDLAWMIEEWGGPFAIKGISRPADARRAADVGVGAVFVSNHGGRQLDAAISAIDALPAIIEEVGDDVEVVLDGGVRRGTDVVKALALGARACAIGRAYLYGLASGGEPGVERALELMEREIRRAMALVGCPDIVDLDASFVRERSDSVGRASSLSA